MVVVAEAMNSGNYYILQPMAIGWAFYIRDSLMETAKKNVKRKTLNVKRSSNCCQFCEA
jgi:hypothetical protein